MPVSASEPTTTALTPPVVVALRCFRCSQFIGEAPRAMEYVGIVKDSALCDLVKPPRHTWKCKCGWYNIFK